MESPQEATRGVAQGTDPIVQFTSFRELYRQIEDASGDILIVTGI